MTTTVEVTEKAIEFFEVLHSFFDKNIRDFIDSNDREGMDQFFKDTQLFDGVYRQLVYIRFDLERIRKGV